jgi:hypothetical protein
MKRFYATFSNGNDRFRLRRMAAHQPMIINKIPLFPSAITRIANMGENFSQRLFDAVLRADLYSFVQAIFPIVSPGNHFSPNWHLEAITYALTRVMKGEITRLIITVPPRSLKSNCASVAFPAFVLGHDPTREIICISYSGELARNHANDCRAVMGSPLYRRIFPRTRISPL